MQDDSPQPGSSDYLDFDLEIGTGTGRDYPVAVLDSPAGEVRGSMHFPFDELMLENRLLTLQNALLRSGGEPRRALSPEGQKVRDFGQALFEALFSREVRACYDVSLREAARQRKGLRLKLRIQSPELAALPWEYLYHPGQREYVSLSTQTPVVRYLEVPQRIQPLTVTPPLRILGMIASPSDLPSLDIEREKGRIEHAIQDLQARGMVELAWLPGQTWRDLMRAMRQGEWHIFHFIGHGGFDQHTGEGLIVLTDEEGRAARFQATQLGLLLADHASLRLVLLNSCEGARGSERDVFSSAASILVRRGIPAVLAMQYEITDRAAVEFARTFYEALADGMPIDGAVAEARKAISFAVTNTVEWGTPVLYTRAPGGVLFEVAERERRAELDSLYRRAVQAVEAGQWQEAQGLLTQVQAMEAGYRETERLLAKAEAEIAAKKKRTARSGRLLRWAVAITAVLVVVTIIVPRLPIFPVRTPTPTPTVSPTATATEEPAPPPVVTTPPPPPPVVTTPPSPTPTGTRVPLPTPLDPVDGEVWAWPDSSAMVFVPEGVFWMGSTDEEIDAILAECGTCNREWFVDEQPQHEVTLDAFWIDRTEVTNAQYAAFLNEQGNRTEDGSSWLALEEADCLIERVGGKYRPKDGYEDHPVVGVTWYGASAYCTWARKRLPTEAEWEKAARGSSDTRMYPWGDSFVGKLLNFCDINCPLGHRTVKWDDSYAETAPVGSYEDGASPYGVLDMAGNVWEWTADWYDSDYYTDSPDRNPEGPDSGWERVVRGGCWYYTKGSVRTTDRHGDIPSTTQSYCGFRCAYSGSEP